ncbi:lactoylglutathione lyase [Pedobacter sp. CG_S7]|uniref:VOC family protein n=1 Tax=Pedobacter sp. CG_S7 TaxID=3143930 RepID=UPI003399B75D
MKQLTLIFILAFSLVPLKRIVAQTTTSTSSARLSHIAVYVTDLKKSTDFYRQILNLQEIEEPFKDGKHTWFSLGAAGQLHLIKGAVKILEHDKNQHLCFSVAAIPDFIKILDAQKVDYSNWPGTAKAPTVRVDGVKQVYFQDPDGQWLEVNDAK